MKYKIYNILDVIRIPILTVLLLACSRPDFSEEYSTNKQYFLIADTTNTNTPFIFESSDKAVILCKAEENCMNLGDGNYIFVYEYEKDLSPEIIKYFIEKTIF